ncbi:MAG: DNA repair protein RadC [Rhodospirillales bacterium]|jgi:DNA repair protein RadC|nr:DNA repair protein RadC [Rhodospirillales bacterium]
MLDGKVPLELYGLSVTTQSPAAGDTLYFVKGETHPYRHLLREAGGRWDAIQRHWVFTGIDPSAALAERLAEARAAGGMSDVAPAAELGGNRPSYWGHRERLRERFLRGSDDALPDYELLELLLFFSIPRCDTKPMAKQLLERFGSLAGTLNAAPEQLADFERMNQQTLALFKALRSLGARLAREDLSEKPILDNWDRLIAYLRACMAHRPIEQFRLLFLDRRNVLIADEVQNQGTIDHTPVYTREVVKRALTLDASAIVMVHNHPSNHPTPSKPDIEMTRQIRDALDKVGILLHDHLIISRRGHTSFRQIGLLEARR